MRNCIHFRTQIFLGNILPRFKAVLAQCSCRCSPRVRLVSSVGCTKWPKPRQDESGVVYRVPRSACDKVCVGDTKRTLGERLQEHCAKTASNKSALAENSKRIGHALKLEDVKVLRRKNTFVCTGKSRRGRGSSASNRRRALSTLIVTGGNVSVVGMFYPFLLLEINSIF